MAALDKVFHMLLEKGGSDLHVATGDAPRMRLHGTLVPIEGAPVLSADQVSDILSEIVSRELWNTFLETSDIDFAYGLEDRARFRANYFRDHSGMAAVFRLIPSVIPPFKDLGMPPSVEKFAHFTNGLVLVTGPTGSGKSTTIAAIIDRINSTYARHIVTIEDPIEFVHTPKKSIVTQREIGTHSESFSEALRSAIRSDPDVILVGEMRDLETIHLAITAAEMGTLVLGTLHTNNAIKTIDRIIDAFPADQQEQTRTMLSESLAGVVSQILLRRRDRKGRVPVVEVLIRTSGLANIIREGNVPMLQSVIQAGRNQGMQSMDDGLMFLARSRVISYEEAFRRASDKAPFQKLLEDVEVATKG